MLFRRLGISGPTLHPLFDTIQIHTDYWDHKHLADKRLSPKVAQNGSAIFQFWLVLSNGERAD